MKLLFQLMLIASGICGLAGCGSASVGPSVESLVPVKGCVTMDNKPVEGAMVVFLPQSSNLAIEAIGMTDADGKYEATFGGATGVPIGTYKVTISRLIDPAGKTVVATLENPPANLGAIESMPLKYSDHAITALKCTIASGGGTFDFKMASK